MATGAACIYKSLRKVIAVGSYATSALGASAPWAWDLAFTIGIDAGVEGVLQHRNYVAIADRRPVKHDQLPAVRRARKMDFIGPHRQMNLTSASKLAEATEDEPDSLLHPQVRIKA